MFGRSSNAVKAMHVIQRIKTNGGSADLSYSQVVCLICNSQDAQKNLSPEELAFFKKVFESYRKDTKCSSVDMNGYLKMCDRIISSFEEKIPFLLVDGEHSENLEMRNQIKIRKLYADGYKFIDALSKYENEYSDIESYKDYDPIENPIAKGYAKEQEYFVSDFVKLFLNNEATLDRYGFLLGIADAIYYLLATKLSKTNPKEETVVSQILCKHQMAV